MAAVDHLSDLQFKFFAHGRHAGNYPTTRVHRVDALNQDGERVGRLDWEPQTGRVENIGVAPDRRRQGIATRMWYEAHSNAQRVGIAHPVHSDDQFPDGNAWAKSTP